MTPQTDTPLLDKISGPEDLRQLDRTALPQLADELRQDVIRIVSQTGGHLGSSLGVIELSLALHYVFKSPHDKIIWDVGHQCYPHKILTGRRAAMEALRQWDGVSGFTKRSESPHDPFGAAHSSTSISAALGYAVGRDLGQDVGDCIAVIGDGAITAGMAYEALNNAGSLNKRLFVILNDNDMSIAPPVGAMSKYLADLGLGVPKRHRARELVTGQPPISTFFEHLGFSYSGPIDGHDMEALVAELLHLKLQMTGPVLLHIKTQKGKGYAPAERAADKYHGVSKFDRATGHQMKRPMNAPSYTAVFGESLLRAAQNDPKIVAITAAMPSGTGVTSMQSHYPGRVFDVGIAEQHAVTFAAGLAASGLRPFCAIYSTFLQRGYDQIVHDVALQNLPVRFAIDRAGLVGEDGATHAGAFDIGYLRSLPNFTIMAPSDEAELVHMMATAAAHDSGPIALRYPRGSGVGVELPTIGIPMEIGKGRIVTHGADVAFLNFGAHLHEVMGAADILGYEGIRPTIADARFAKPLDTALIDHLCATHDLVITVEQGALGGFGAAVLEYLHARPSHTASAPKTARVQAFTLPDRFIDQGSPKNMYQDAQLTATDIAERTHEALHQLMSTASQSPL